MIWISTRRRRHAFRFSLFLTIVLGGWMPHSVWGANKKPVLIDVLLPADAVLEVNGYKTKSMGEMRRFESPPVAEGRPYAYSLKVTWRGQSLTRRIEVQPDKLKTLDFRDELTALTAPKSKGSFSLLVPPSLMVPAEGSAPLPIRVKRFNFPDAIRVSLHNLPKGIIASDAVLTDGQTDVETLVVATREAGPGTRQINLVAVSGDTQDSATIEIALVEPTPKVDRSSPPRPKDQDDTNTLPIEGKTPTKLVEAPATLELIFPNAMELRAGQSHLLEIRMKTANATPLAVSPTVTMDAGGIPLRTVLWTSSFKPDKPVCTIGLAISVDKACTPGEFEACVRVAAGRGKAERSMRLTIKK